MPEMSLKDTIVTSLTAQEPWPDNVKLFQPYEVEQILLPDNASCLAVQAFLKMCNLPFEVEMRWNAEFMSPSGRVPFIKCGAFVVSELEPIVQFAANKGVTLCENLSGEERAEMRAYMSLISNVLVNAELYISWLDDDTYNTVTKVRNSSVYPWPLSWIQTRSKRSAVSKRLKALHWHDKTMEQVLADVEQCCNSLSQRLGDKDYFFGTPTALDALLSGHIRALLSATGPKAKMMIRPITGTLLKHTLRVAHLTGMVLTPQEEYLVSQVYRQPSPSRVSERSARSRKSKLSFKFECIDTCGNNKPFASKLIHMSRDEEVSCDHPKRHTKNKHIVHFIRSLMEEIIEHVEDITYENERYGGTYEIIKDMYDIDETTDFMNETDNADILALDTSIDEHDFSYNEAVCEEEQFYPTDSGTRVPKSRGYQSAIPVPIKCDSNMSSRSGSPVKACNRNAHGISKRLPSAKSTRFWKESSPSLSPGLRRRGFPPSPSSVSPPVRSTNSSPRHMRRGSSMGDRSSPDPISPVLFSPELTKKLSGNQFFSELKSTMRHRKNSEESIDIENIMSLLRENNTFAPKSELIADLD